MHYVRLVHSRQQFLFTGGKENEMSRYIDADALKEWLDEYLSVFKNLPYAEKYEHIGDCELYFRPYEIYCLSSGKKK